MDLQFEIVSQDRIGKSCLDQVIIKVLSGIPHTI